MKATRRKLTTAWPLLIFLLLPPLTRAENQPAPIPFSEIGAKATADYQGNALTVTATRDGAQLRCGFQKLEGRATPEGLWLKSTESGGGKLRLTATAATREVFECGSPLPLSNAPVLAENGRGLPHFRTLARSSSRLSVSGQGTLSRTGTVSVADRVVRFTRVGLTEEYSVSADGVRQDFVVTERPAGAGDLRVELAASGARAEAAAYGAKLTLDGSGRKLAYSRLRVADARGRELTARLEVLSVGDEVTRLRSNGEGRERKADPSQSLLASTVRSAGTKDGLAPAGARLVVVVNDAEAVYPVRVDPTFSDANWISMGGLPGVNGTVYAAVVDAAGNLYIGGDFTVAGEAIANRVAKWDGSAWSALGSGMSGGYAFNSTTVRALAVSGMDLYAGGDFTTAGGVPVSCIAKWDGSVWSGLGDGMGGTFWTDPHVSTLVASGADLYVGGSFATAGGVTAYNIARWDGSAWWALGGGLGGNVNALAVSGTTLYAGGDFDSAGGTAASCVAKWDGTTWSGLGSGMDGDYTYYPYVSALAVSGNVLYAGGRFWMAGGVLTTNIAKWNGTTWSALGRGISCDWENSSVSALVVSGTDLYAGGHFYTFWEGSEYGFAKWNGSVWSDLKMTDGAVNALAMSGANLYVGGAFRRPVGANIAKWDGSAWSALGNGLNGNVYALAVLGSDLYAGGDFTIITANGARANFIAKWDGSSWSALGSGTEGHVSALAGSGTDLYAGGYFTKAGGVSASCIAKWDGKAWSALGSGVSVFDFDSPVRALVMWGTNLYAGGNFMTAGGVAATNIAKWNGSAWSALGSGIQGWDGGAGVHALAVMGTNLYAGGRFSQPTMYLAKWDGKAWSAVGDGIYGCIAYGDVLALAVSGNNLYAGGRFTAAGSVSANNIARWNGSKWSTLGSGIVGEITQTSGGVYALAVSGSDVYAGGEFTMAGSVSANNIAKWNGSAWSALGSGTDGGVSALAVSGTSLFAGGEFLAAGGKQSSYVARAELSQLVPDIASQPASRTNSLGATATFSVTATGKAPLSYFWRKDGTNYLSDDGNISGARTNNLLISNLQFGDAGSYSVLVSNAYGMVASSNAVLTVADFIPPGLLITSHTDLQIVRTNRIVLCGSASDAGLGDNGVLGVRVNGLEATNGTASGSGVANWSRAVSLVAGVNPIRVVATDNARAHSSTTNVIRIIADTSAPTLGITAPSPGQRWSNAVLTVKGTVKDNAQVTGVWCQTNGVWGLAPTANGWTNWTVDVAVVPGTNTVRAYAVDAAGNRSATNSVSFVYVLTAPLSLAIVGQGTIAGATNGQRLELGKTVTLKATPGTGYMLTNWLVQVDGLTVVSTNRTVPFVMRSNLVLTATFVDVQKPVLAVTVPTANQRWSNAVFTVKGTAKDNAGVSNVWFQVNEGAWTNASTGNNWTNWTAEVSLTPGTNVVKACAVDVAGNRSATNSVSFIYVLSDRLVVQTTGRGTLSPNYSNAVLEIGKLYGMKATGISGYAFTNWVISTNWAGSLTTNNPTLQFRMQSNLTLLANFVDVTKPTNTITAPKAGQRWSNAVFTVTGTAKDNICVAEVWYRLNTNDWARARTDNGWTNWMAEVELTPGTNMLWVYAEDCIGNRSRTNSANVVYVLSDRLVVQTTGRGTLSPNYSNAVLEIGKSYTMTATAVTGFALTNWTTCAGEFLTNKQVLRFVMQSNLCLQANFVDVAKPTVVIAAPTASQRWSNALFTVKGTAKDNVGVSNVRLQLNEGAWTNVSTGNNWSNWTVGVNLTPGTNVLRAYAVDTVGNWSATNRVSFTYVLTYSLADYYYPPQPGAVWLYQGPDWSSATHTRVRMADINYSLLLPCPSAVTRQVCVLDSDYGYYSDGVFDSTENWQDYTSVSNGFAFYGFDDNAEPEHDTEPEESGRFPMTPLPTRMAVGQSVTRTGVYCDKQGRSLGTVSLKVELRGQTEVTVPAGYYPDCLHLRFTKTAGSVNKVDEEWWALGIGVIKNTRISGYSSQNNNGGYLQELISTTATKARPQALALAGDFPTAVFIGKTAVSNGQIQMRWNGPVGKLVVLESSEDLRHWKPLQTNTVPAEGIVLSVPMTNHPAQFFRVHLP